MKLLFSLASLAALALFGWVAMSLSESESTSASLSATQVTETGTVADEKETVSRPQPKLVIEEKEFDFGTVDPGQTYQHTFNIRNEGDAPLELGKGGATCQCADVKILHRVIDPGMTGQVILSWDTWKSADKFSEGFQLVTNDPETPRLMLRANGSLLVSMWAEPGRLSFDSLESGKPIAGSTVLFSQKLKQLHIREVTSSLAGLRWEAKQPAGNTVRELDATAAINLVFQADGLTDKGAFNHYVRIVASETPDSPEKDWLVMDVQLVGSVVGRYRLTSDSLNYFNKFDIRSVRSDRDHEFTFLLKVACDPKQLPLSEFESYPEGLTLDWKEIDSNKGVYKGTIKVPAGLPNGDYQQEGNEGWVRMRFDHPEIPAIKVPLVIRLFQPSADVSY